MANMIKHKMGCRYDGKCKSKTVIMSNKKGKRDTYRVYCSFESTCNQQVYHAPKYEAPEVATQNP